MADGKTCVLSHNAAPLQQVPAPQSFVCTAVFFTAMLGHCVDGIPVSLRADSSKVHHA